MEPTLAKDAKIANAKIDNLLLMGAHVIDRPTFELINFGELEAKLHTGQKLCAHFSSSQLEGNSAGNFSKAGIVPSVACPIHQLRQ
jgi:hypothetical protein